ncbi:hypothetical protein GCM10022197_14480 [Microlunatus spumicola]|uniref:Uncharacterized protein n=1 Tax=Microlunatus spumicola TaxID=81499 RepID=A0ABP6X1S0_9ACTN
MSTATLLLVVGGVVCVKTLAFVTLIVRRGRRQRRELDVAAAALAVAESAVPVPPDPSGWRLQWAEPGVMLVQNTSDEVPAREVRLSATLTASSGAEASVDQAVRFVGTGACFTARFADLERWLTEAAAAAGLGRDREPAPQRLACTLSYTMAWRTPEGERRRETRVAQGVVPVPDLSPGLA